MNIGHDAVTLSDRHDAGKYDRKRCNPFRTLNNPTITQTASD
jgi:hypothetical protein